jgi:hypothetical protein
LLTAWADSRQPRFVYAQLRLTYIIYFVKVSQKNQDVYRITAGSKDCIGGKRRKRCHTHPDGLLAWGRLLEKKLCKKWRKPGGGGEAFNSHFFKEGGNWTWEGISMVCLRWRG